MSIKRASYPTVGLSKAVEETQKLWKAAQHAPITTEVAVKTLGFKSVSGPARSRLAALRHFGLIEEAGKEVIRLSALGKTIVVQPDGYVKEEAIKEAALTPKLFREILPIYVNASDPVLKGFLITNKSYNEDSAKAAIRSFRDTVSFAKLEETPLNPDSKDAILTTDESENEDGADEYQGDNGTDNGSAVKKPPVLKGGVMYSVNIEVLKSGQINVAAAGDLNEKTFALMKEIFDLKQRHETSIADEATATADKWTSAAENEDE